MRTSFLLKMFVFSTCFFIILFGMVCILKWEDFSTLSVFFNNAAPIMVFAVLSVWGFGLVADHHKKCVEVEDKVIDKSKKIFSYTAERKKQVNDRYKVLMNIRSNDNAYYNVLRRAC